MEQKEHASELSRFSSPQKSQSFKNITLLLGVFLLAILLAPSAAFAAPAQQEFTADFEPADCFFEVDSPFTTPDMLGFECGFVTVPELHDVPDGDTIRLPVAIRKATASNPQPDPIFLAQGGPGGDAFVAFSITVPSSQLAADRDIVIFNQRGTEFAEPRLHCQELIDIRDEQFATTDDEESKRLDDEALAACHARLLDEGINLSAFNSIENAKDIDLIRQALGYETYNFYGVSYGTLLGLHLIGLNPPALRSVILDSVVPTQINFVPMIAQTENRAYDEYFAICTELADCEDVYPDLEARTLALYEQLNESPVTMAFTNEDTGEVLESVIAGDDVADIMFSLFYIPGFYAIFPRFIEDLEQGEFGPFEDLASLLLFDESISFGMYFSVLCAEDGDFSGADVPLEGVRPFISKDAAEEADELVEVCDLWGVDEFPSSIDDPIVSDIPTMLISGRFDPITPPAFAAEAAKTLSNSVNVVNPLGSHGNIWGGDACSVQIAEDFLNDPLSTPDTSCYADEEAQATIDPTAMPVRLVRQALTDQTTLVQLGALVLMALILLSGILIWPIVWIVRRVREREPLLERRGARISGRLLTLLTGITTLGLLGGFVFYAASVFETPGLILYSGLPAEARTIFFLAPVIILLVLSSLLLLLRAWRDSSTWGKIYQGLMMVCLVGIGVLLFVLGMFEPLLA